MPLSGNQTLDTLTTESHWLRQVFFSLDEFMAMERPSVPLKNIFMMGDGRSSCGKIQEYQADFHKRTGTFMSGIAECVCGTENQVVSL